MRCLSCNCLLTDFESSVKYFGTNHYVDLCKKCFKEIESDLINYYDYDTETDLSEYSVDSPNIDIKE